MSVYSHQFFDQQSAGSLASAHVVLKVLFDIAPFKSVVDIGCGLAPWLRAAKDFGVNYAVGLDGDYVDRKRLLVEPVCFRPCDLEAEDPRRVVGDDGLFELAICMEVAEHLSARRAPAFVTELCGLSDLVLFSAAIPGQGGTNHVNEQWPEYWAAMFANNSFVCFDVLRPCLWSHEECEWWYIQNALLFAKRDTKASGIAARLGPPAVSPMPLVHPRMLSGRDAGMRALEAEVGRLRTMVLEKSNEAELLSSSLERVRAELATLRSERDRLAQENTTMRVSTSWRIPALIKMIARGGAWFEELATGRVRSLQDLARRDGITRRYIRRLVSLAFLSPDLVETILQGRQPVELSATRLTALDLPLDWVEQRRLLAS